MPLHVPLKKIVDAIEDCDLDGVQAFLHRTTGEVVMYSDEDRSDLDDEETDVPDWQKPILEAIRDVDEHPDDYLPLPDKSDLHEWDIMRRFSETVEDDAVRADLLNAIRGSGAFRYFKDTLHRHGIEKEWYSYRDEAIRQVAIDWCLGHEIEYVDENERAQERR